MKRDYTNGVKDNVTFFTGIEVEKTPAYGMKTLFVVGHQSVNKIIEIADANECKHVFVGANHSFDPSRDMAEKSLSLDDVMRPWDHMILSLLKSNYFVTLDFDVRYVETVLGSGYCEYNGFIPQISVKIPYVKQFNYNVMLKIDDKDFKASNPGVWCHSLHNLLDRNQFTSWDQYSKDNPV